MVQIGLHQLFTSTKVYYYLTKHLIAYFIEVPPHPKENESHSAVCIHSCNQLQQHFLEVDTLVHQGVTAAPNDKSLAITSEEARRDRGAANRRPLARIHATLLLLKTNTRRHTHTHTQIYTHRHIDRHSRTQAQTNIHIRTFTFYLGICRVLIFDM